MNFKPTTLTSEQLELRKTVICGSDTPGIMGHGFQNAQEIYYIKKGIREVDLSDNKDVQRGKRHENLVAYLYTEKTKRKLTKPRKMLFSRHYHWLGGNPDRYVHDKEKGKGILEIKCPNQYSFDNIIESGKAPIYYLIQAQHYMIVTNLDWAAIAIYCANTDELIEFDIHYNAPLAAKILKHTSRFYDDLQANRIPEIKHVKIEKLPVIDNKMVEIDNDVDLMRDIYDMEEAERLKKQYTDIYEEKMESIKRRIGNNKVTKSFGIKFTKKVHKGKRSFDIDRFKHDYPDADIDLYAPRGEDYEKMTKSVLKNG